jgi:hypothetical protein
MSGSFTAEGWRNHRGVSKWQQYQMWRSGTGPRFYMVGTRRFITAEADAEWVQRQEELTQSAEAKAALEKASERGRAIVKREGVV